MTVLKRLWRLARDLRGWGGLDYTGRQLLLRKLFTVPFLAALPLMIAAGAYSRVVRRRVEKELR